MNMEHLNYDENNAGYEHAEALKAIQEKEWEDCTPVERHIGNQEHVASQHRRFLKSEAAEEFVFAKLAIEKELKSIQEYLDGLYEGKYDWVNEK